MAHSGHYRRSQVRQVIETAAAASQAQGRQRQGLPEVSVSTVQWLDKPEFPLSERERSLTGFQSAVAEMDGKTIRPQMGIVFRSRISTPRFPSRRPAMPASATLPRPLPRKRPTVMRHVIGPLWRPGEVPGNGLSVIRLASTIIGSSGKLSLPVVACAWPKSAPLSLAASGTCRRTPSG